MPSNATGWLVGAVGVKWAKENVQSRVARRAKFLQFISCIIKGQTAARLQVKG